MKLLPLISLLCLWATPSFAAPIKLLCTESDGVHIMEANEVMEYFGSKKAEQSICAEDNSFGEDCHTESLVLDHDNYDPITIEFNSDTGEAVVKRFSEIIFYSVDERRDQYRLVRQRRPLLESTYQSTGHQSFYEYSIVIEKESLSTIYTESVDRTDWGSAGEGGILYTTIINGSCKKSSF